jgi:hypothetical protein
VSTRSATSAVPRSMTSSGKRLASARHRLEAPAGRARWRRATYRPGARLGPERPIRSGRHPAAERQMSAPIGRRPDSRVAGPATAAFRCASELRATRDVRALLHSVSSDQ